MTIFQNSTYCKLKTQEGNGFFFNYKVAYCEMKASIANKELGDQSLQSRVAKSLNFVYTETRIRELRKVESFIWIARCNMQLDGWE